METTRKISLKGEITLNSGVQIKDLQATYTLTTNAELNYQKVIWVFHPLTASSENSDWWPKTSAYLSEAYPLHTQLCVNALGSSYGSSAPDQEFWDLTIADQVQFFQLVARELGIHQVDLGIGGSLGGQQLIQWIAQDPAFFNSAVLVATNAKHSPWGKAFNASQRHAILQDSDPQLKEGLALAREIAMLSYRTPLMYNLTQQDDVPGKEISRAESYQKYQGQKLQERFDAYSYFALTKAMDSQAVLDNDLLVSNLAAFQGEVLAVGITTDHLFPAEEQVQLYELFGNASYAEMDSPFGHDAFLAEEDKLVDILKAWNKQVNPIKTPYPIHNEAV